MSQAGHKCHTGEQHQKDTAPNIIGADKISLAMDKINLNPYPF